MLTLTQHLMVYIYFFIFEHLVVMVQVTFIYSVTYSFRLIGLVGGVRY